MAGCLGHLVPFLDGTGETSWIMSFSSTDLLLESGEAPEAALLLLLPGEAASSSASASGMAPLASALAEAAWRREAKRLADWERLITWGAEGTIWRKRLH